MDFKRRCKELSKYLYCLCHKCPLHFSMSDIHPKSFGCKAIFYSPLHFCSFERTWPSWIIRYSWFCCPCMRCEMSVHQKNGGELMNIRCDFFSSYPFFFMLHLWAVCQNSEMPLATLKRHKNEFSFSSLSPKIHGEDCYLKWKICQQIEAKG